MVVDGSYDIDQIAIDREREMTRLNAQLDLFWPQEHALYKRLGLVDGVSVLDCGCGPGYLLEKIHALYPRVRCTGIEISDSLFDAAQATIEKKQLDRCKVYRQSITEMDFPDESFDFVIVRLVLEHLPQPVVALREVLRVLKRNGRAVIVDNDFDYHVRTYPDVPELVDLYSAYCAARIAEKGNPRIGRQLPEMLLLAGFSDISFDMVCAHNRIAGDEAFSSSEGSGIALQLVKTGYLDKNIYDRLAVNWSAMLKNRSHSIVRLLFVGSGRKLMDAATAPMAHTEINSDAVGGINMASLAEYKATGRLKEGLIKVVAQELGIEQEKIVKDRTLGDLGLDSVAAVSLRNTIENQLQTAIPSLEFLNSHTIEEISSFIVEHQREVKKASSDTRHETDAFEEGEL